jgi:hypothetical protein
MGLDVRLPVPVLEDNIAAVHLSLRPSLNAGRARHMEVRWHWMQHQVARGQVRLLHLTTDWQLADLFTKALGKKRHQFLTELIQGDQPAFSGEIRRAIAKFDRTQGNLAEDSVTEHGEEEANAAGQHPQSKMTGEMAEEMVDEMADALGADAEATNVREVDTRTHLGTTPRGNTSTANCDDKLELANSMSGFAILDAVEAMRQTSGLIQKRCPDLLRHEELYQDTLARLRGCHERHHLLQTSERNDISSHARMAGYAPCRLCGHMLLQRDGG